MHWIALQSPPDLQAIQAATLTDPLTALGWWALQFTPKVALLPDAVLLEVSASERLWGGRAALLRRIYMDNKPVTLIKYARAATSLVAVGRLYAAQPASTAADDLPLTALAAAQPHLATLMRLGCSTWGQLRRLPRDGLARRFGAALLDALDQAYGERPDSYPWLTLPDVFEARLELPSQIDSAPALLFGARRLLAQLQVWLQLRQLGVLAIELGWHMDARRNTDKTGALTLRSAQPTTGTAHLQRLLGERLAQLTLPAPVHTLCLRSLETCQLANQSASLLPDDQLPGDSLTQTIERLSARLGAGHVLRLQARADHRPEHRQAWVAATSTIEKVAYSASSKRTAGKKGIIKPAMAAGVSKGAAQALPKDWASALYPTWLLAEPLQLALHQQPHYQGPLTLLAGPQRLEAGWWPQPPDSLALPAQALAKQKASAGDTALRDYFVARNPQATLLWIYRERLGSADKPGQSCAWYLHGIFA
jgi:protein ImuB